MTKVTILPIIDPAPKKGTPLVKVMNERLINLAAELQAVLQREFFEERFCEDLVIYMSYNSKYKIRWKIVNDVPGYVSQQVENQCGKLGYIAWKELELYSFKVNRLS